MYVRTSTRRNSGLSGYSRRGLGDAGSFVQAMAAAIRGKEGYNPNFSGNNNPGNIVYSRAWNYPGAVPGAGGFARYPDMATGEAALEHQIKVQIASGQNLIQFFNQYAPGNTKNAAGGVQTQAATNRYVSDVAAQLGIDPTVPLNQIQDSWNGPGSYSGSPDSSTTSDTPSNTSPFDFSSFIPDSLSSSTQYDLGGLVLSGSDLLLIGGVGLAAVVLFAML